MIWESYPNPRPKAGSLCAGAHLNARASHRILNTIAWIAELPGIASDPHHPCLDARFARSRTQVQAEGLK